MCTFLTFLLTLHYIARALNPSQPGCSEHQCSHILNSQCCHSGLADPRSFPGVLLRLPPIFPTSNCPFQAIACLVTRLVRSFTVHVSLKTLLPKCCHHPPDIFPLGFSPWHPTTPPDTLIYFYTHSLFGWSLPSTFLLFASPTLRQPLCAILYNISLECCPPSNFPLSSVHLARVCCVAGAVVAVVLTKSNLINTQ